jgi:hypothetical protein
MTPDTSEPIVGQTPGGQAARSMLGLKARPNLLDLITDATAGMQGATGKIGAFASGMGGTLQAGEKRREAAKKQAVDAEQKQYDRKGTDQERDLKGKEFTQKELAAKDTHRKSTLEYLKGLKSLANDEEADKRAAAFLENDTLMSFEDKMKTWQDYKAGKFKGGAAKAQGGGPQPGMRMKGPDGGVVKYDAQKGWIDEATGEPVDLPTQ